VWQVAGIMFCLGVLVRSGWVCRCMLEGKEGGQGWLLVWCTLMNCAVSHVFIAESASGRTVSGLEARVCCLLMG
jgi:hypothetical protein